MTPPSWDRTAVQRRLHRTRALQKLNLKTQFGFREVPKTTVGYS